MKSCLRGYCGWTAAAAIFGGLEVVLEVFIPMLMSVIVDGGLYREDDFMLRGLFPDALVAQRDRFVLTVGGIMVLIACLSMACGLLSARCSAVASQGVAKNLRTQLLDKIQSFSFSNIDHFSTPSLITRATTDVNTVRTTMYQIIRSLTRSPIMLVLATVMAFTISLLLGLAALYALSAVTNYLLNRLMLECSTVIMRALRTELFSKMQKLPIHYFDANTHGSLMSYFTNDIEATNELLQHAITQMLISVMSLLGTIGMMLALSMKLFSLMVVLAAIVVTVVRVITKKSNRAYRQQQKDAASVNGFVEEMIAGQRDVKAFTHEKQVMQNFAPINESFYQSSALATTVTFVVGPILNNLSHFFLRADLRRGRSVAHGRKRGRRAHHVPRLYPHLC